MNSDKAQAAKKKAGLAAAKALLKASAAVRAFKMACYNCGEGSVNLDDTRVTLPEKMSEYGNYLSDRFDK